MQKNLIRMDFFETYYIANIVNNIIREPGPYIRGVHEFWEDNEVEVFVPPFPKWSRLHGFVAHILDSLISEEISYETVDKVIANSSHQIWVDRALKHHNFDSIGLQHWLREKSIKAEDFNIDHLADYYSTHYDYGHLIELSRHISNEVFYILFGNRGLMETFNSFMAATMQDYFDEPETMGVEDYFQKPNVLKRVHIPQWVRRAVFFRDKGMCSLCNKDISGLITSQPDTHYDHIYPLVRGGLNDVTNIQLLCQDCNLSKGSKVENVSNVYEAWY